MISDREQIMLNLIIHEMRIIREPYPENVHREADFIYRLGRFILTADPKRDANVLETEYYKTLDYLLKKNSAIRLKSTDKYSSAGEF